MSIRPDLTRQLNKNTFLDYYYLKEELIQFCRQNKLPIGGGKIELTNRIAYFLETGQVLNHKTVSQSKTKVSTLTTETLIEDHFVCSEIHRAFFKEKIGNSFSFNVTFQKWLKVNTGKTYGDAIVAYHQILEEKKNKKTSIDKQFEYNTYIRDFFADNQGKSLEQAILCWKYKKSLSGHNRYEKEDLIVLK